MAVRACSFAHNRANSGEASGSKRDEEVAADPGRMSCSRRLSDGAAGRVALDRADRKPHQATVSLRTTVRARAAKVLQASGKPKKFGRRDFSRRPMTWVCSTDRRANRILRYLAGQGTPTFLWSATE